MQFLTKKTTELSVSEKCGLVDLFNDVFAKERTIEEFERQFLNNCDGGSYHTFAIEDDRIVASNTMIPAIYQVSGERLRFVNSVDTMIAIRHRGLENFYDMIKASFRDSEQRGFDAVYGFPNDNSYELFTKLKFMKDVGKLDTYCLPYRVGGVKNGFKFLNPLSRAFSRVWVWCSSLFASNKVANYEIEKDASSYNATRYKRGDGEYSIVEGLFVYKVMSYEGIRTAFIIDVFEKSAKNFCRSVNYLLKNERAGFDLILYVGHLQFGSCGLIKIPHKYEPKHFNFTAAIFNKKNIDKKAFFELDNWDVNLSSYDVI